MAHDNNAIYLELLFIWFLFRCYFFYLNLNVFIACWRKNTNWALKQFCAIHLTSYLIKWTDLDVFVLKSDCCWWCTFFRVFVYVWLSASELMWIHVWHIKKEQKKIICEFSLKITYWQPSLVIGCFRHQHFISTHHIYCIKTVFSVGKKLFIFYFFWFFSVKKNKSQFRTRHIRERSRKSRIICSV